MVLAFVTVSAAFGDSALRGLTALSLGLTLGLVGIDLQTGQARLTFGIPDLLDGIEVTTLAVALFAVGEALKVASSPTHQDERIEPVRGLGLDDGDRTGRGRGSPGCAAPRSAFRSARCRRAAPRSAPSSATRPRRR